MPSPLKPLERTALLTAFGAPTRTLKRTRGGFVSSTKPAQVFSRRVMNWLDERALIDFDNRMFPTVATLTKLGVQQAEALIEKARAQAGAA